MTTVNVVSLLLIIGIILVMFREKLDGRDEVIGTKLRIFNSDKEEWNFPNFFYILLIYGIIAIRFIGLGNIPGGFNQDGAMGAVDALALAEYGTDRFGTWLPAHFTAWGYGQMSVLLSYLTVPFIKLWGLNSVTARLPMLIVSLAGASAVYRIVKELFSTKAATIALLFLAINPWHFMQSRWALDCNVFPHMFIIGLCFLIIGMRKKYGIYLSMIFFALCMYSYGVSFYMVPTFLLFAAIILLLAKKVTWKQLLIACAIYFGLAFPIYGTMLINFMKWDTVSLPFVTMPYFKDSIRTNDMLFFSEQPFRQLLANINSLIRVVFLQKPDLIWNAIDDFGTMYQCSIPLVLVGIGITFYNAKHEKNLEKKTINIMLLTYWGCSVFVGICINSVNVNRINIIFYSHIILAGIAIYYVVKKWRSIALVFFIIYSIQSALFFNRYFTVWADQMEDIFYEDFLDAVEFAGNQECDYYYITPDTQYEGSANVSEILTMFAQQIDAEYYQGKTNQYRGTQISYADRYRFKNPEMEEINAEQKTAYVIKSENLSNYDLNLFKVKRFDNYCVVMPAQYAEW